MLPVNGVLFQEFPQNLSAPVINPFALNDLLSVRSGIVAMRLTRRKARLRTEIRSDCGPLDEGPSRWYLCIVNNIRYSLPAWARWNRVQHFTESRAGLRRSGPAQKKWGNSSVLLAKPVKCLEIYWEHSVYSPRYLALKKVSSVSRPKKLERRGDPGGRELYYGRDVA